MVQAVTAGAPAWEAGMRPRDVIIRTGDRDDLQGSYYDVRRGTDTLRLELVDTFACPGWPLVPPEEEQNAYTDGEWVTITQGMVKWLGTDDRVAAVLSHEVGHVIADHIGKRKRNAVGGAFLGALLSAATRVVTRCSYCGSGLASGGANAGAAMYSQDFELEADYLGIYLAHSAGFDINVWPELFIDIGAAHGVGYGKTHPTNSERAAQLAGIIQEINEKVALGEPVVPNPKNR